MSTSGVAEANDCRERRNHDSLYCTCEQGSLVRWSHFWMVLIPSLTPSHVLEPWY